MHFLPKQDVFEYLYSNFGNSREVPGMKQNFSGIPVPGNGKFPGILSTLMHTGCCPGLHPKCIMYLQERRKKCLESCWSISISFLLEAKCRVNFLSKILSRSLISSHGQFSSQKSDVCLSICTLFTHVGSSFKSISKSNFAFSNTALSNCLIVIDLMHELQRGEAPP